MVNSSDIHLPNPFTPMAFLPPDEAYHKTIAEYIIVGGLSVIVWDVLTHLHADYKLLTRYRITLPTMIYFLSRWSTLLCMISSAIFQTAPVKDCAIISKVVCALYHVTVSSTALLFFLRTRAIFNQNRYITAGFFCLWLVVVVGSLSSLLSLPGVPIGTTRYCAFSTFASYGSAANITLATFDTCVFIAITWRLLNDQYFTKSNDSISAKKKFLLGGYLPAFSRALLQDGQKYYMIAMLANILVVILEFAPGIPSTYRSVSLAPAIGITNIMACGVFRDTKMKCKYEDIRAVSSIAFQKSNNAPVFGLHTQMGGLTTNSTTGNELHSSSAPDTTAPSQNSLDKLARLSKEVISVV